MASVTRNSDENRARAEAQTPADGTGDTGSASEKPARVAKGDAKDDGGTRAVEPARVAVPGARGCRLTASDGHPILGLSPAALPDSFGNVAALDASRAAFFMRSYGRATL